MSHLSKPFVSVIIPVLNDPKRLSICLSALEKQTYPQSLYEVIVVDNGSDESIDSIVSQFSRTSTAYESHPGSYAARNRGILLAKGEVIAFTDADCIPAPDWIETGVINLSKVPHCGLVAGKIEIFFQDPARPTAVELYESVTAFPQKKYVEEKKFGATANLFTSKQVINAVGSFNANLKSSGDFEWGQRVFEAGYKQIYIDELCVAHPARQSFEELHKKVVRLIVGFRDAGREDKNFNFVRFLIKDMRPPLKAIFRVFLDRRLAGLTQKTTVAWVVIFEKYLWAWERIRLQLESRPTDEVISS